VSSSLDQQHLCRVTVWELDKVAAQCQPGQKVLFLPKSFGDQHIPGVFAALHCDLRYSVAMTQGAVACIYLPVKRVTAPPRN